MDFSIMRIFSMLPILLVSFFIYRLLIILKKDFEDFQYVESHKEVFEAVKSVLSDSFQHQDQIFAELKNALPAAKLYEGNEIVVYRILAITAKHPLKYGIFMNSVKMDPSRQQRLKEFYQIDHEFSLYDYYYCLR